MVKKCYVLNCPSGRKSCKEKVSLFKAPKNEFMLEIWRNNVPQKERILCSTDRICEKHFDKKLVIPRFEPSTVGDFLKDHFRPKLAPNAIPTIFNKVERNDPRIKKYKSTGSSTPKKSTNSQTDTKSVELADVEVSDNDHISICFKCLIGDCVVHE